MKKKFDVLAFYAIDDGLFSDSIKYIFYLHAKSFYRKKGRWEEEKKEISGNCYFEISDNKPIKVFPSLYKKWDALLKFETAIGLAVGRC